MGVTSCVEQRCANSGGFNPVWAGPEASKKDGRNSGVAFIPVDFGYWINFAIPLPGDWFEQLHLFLIVLNCISCLLGIV